MSHIYILRILYLLSIYFIYIFFCAVVCFVPFRGSWGLLVPPVKIVLGPRPLSRVHVYRVLSLLLCSQHTLAFWASAVCDCGGTLLFCRLHA